MWSIHERESREDSKGAMPDEGDAIIIPEKDKKEKKN